MGLVSRLSFLFGLKSPPWWCMPCSAKMDAREKDSGRWSDMWCFLLTFSELFWLVVAYCPVFLTRTSCHKTSHANGYYGAWPGWAVSVSVLPLTQGVLTLNTERKKMVNWNESKFLFHENSCKEKKLATEWKKIFANYSPTNN